MYALTEDAQHTLHPVSVVHTLHLRNTALYHITAHDIALTYNIPHHSVYQILDT